MFTNTKWKVKGEKNIERKKISPEENVVDKVDVKKERNKRINKEKDVNNAKRKKERKKCNE